MKGRSSTVVCIRLPDDTYAILKGRAKGLTVGKYIKGQILRSVKSNHSDYPNVITKESHSPLSKPLEIYDRNKHKAGDRVLIRQGKKLVEAVVPEIDAEGNPM